MTRSRSDNPTTAMVNNATLRYWYTGHGWTGMLRFIGGARKQLWASSEEALFDKAVNRVAEWNEADHAASLEFIRNAMARDHLAIITKLGTVKPVQSP